MFKKAGTVTIAVTAGLLAAAPFASAGEAHDHDGDHHGKKKHGHESSDCNVVGGEAEANGGIEGNAGLGNVLGQLPVGGNNVGNIVCNDILNDNLSGNDVAISVLGGAEAS
jgi:hypothetical protein